MDVTQLSAYASECLDKLLANGPEIVSIFEKEEDADQTTVRLAEVMGGLEDQTMRALIPLFLLDEEMAGRMHFEQEVQQTTDPEEIKKRAELIELRERFAPFVSRLQSVLSIVSDIEGHGRAGWGDRTATRRITLDTSVPMLGVRVMSSRDPEVELFYTEESTHAFLRNATGLLFSTKRTYEECIEHGHKIPQLMRRKDRWALRELVEVVSELCELHGATISELLSELQNEQMEKDAQ